MAQYAVLIFERVPPEELPEDVMQGHMQLPDRIAEQGGRVVAGLALEPPETATAIRGGAITDGPFIETKEVLGGVFVIEARDLDHALALARHDADRRRRRRGAAARRLRGPGGGLSAVEQAVADAHRREWAFVLAATVRVTRDLDTAEEAVQDAYVQALETWTRDGVPARPGAWLTTVARRLALNLLRRRRTLEAKLPLLVEPEADDPHDGGPDMEAIPDDRLRLVFTCCHPALALEAQVALTLRLVCGVATPGRRPCVPRLRADDGGADHAREEEDRRRPDPVRGAGAGGPAGPARRGAHRDPPALHDRSHAPGRATGSCATS